MPKIVVSLTSYPVRIHTVYRVIESLFRQRKKADEIVLWLSVLEFPNGDNDLPENLKNLSGKNGFHIEWVKENIKSHKKYFYALQNNKHIVITIDDDMYYSDTMIETLMDSYRQHPHAVSARNVNVMMRDKDQISPYAAWDGRADEYRELERMDLCAIGVNGILYPPKCSTDKWFDIESISAYAGNQDDLWLKYNEVIDGIPVVYTGIQERDHVLEGTQSSALYRKNLHGGDNDACIKMLWKKMWEDYGNVYNRWFQSLMLKEEALHAKRKYLTETLNNIFLKCGSRDVYICGAGKYAHILYDFIESCGKERRIKAFLVSEIMQGELGENVPKRKLIRSLNKQEPFCVICGVGEKYKAELQAALRLHVLHEWIEMDLISMKRLLELEKDDREMKNGCDTKSNGK